MSAPIERDFFRHHRVGYVFQTMARQTYPYCIASKAYVGYNISETNFVNPSV